jgi:hypothetical protein
MHLFPRTLCRALRNLRRAARTLRRALRISWVSAVLLLALPAGSTEPLEDPGWQRAERAGITVVHRPGESRPARSILEVAVRRGPEIAAALGQSDLGDLTIYVASSASDFALLTLGGAPDWGAGCAFPDRGVIVVKSPAVLPDPLQTTDVVVHEIAHVVSGRALGGVRTPRWFEEGMAMTLAGEWRLPDRPRISAAAASGDLIPLSDLRSGFPGDASRAMLAYVESYQAVRFLMERSGVTTPGGLVEAIRSAGSFEAAVEGLYGASLQVFEKEARSSFGSRFGWGFLLTRWNVLFLAIALLLLLAGTLRIRRSRERIRRWAEEDAREGTLRDQGLTRDTRWQ